MENEEEEEEEALEELGIWEFVWKTSPYSDWLANPSGYSPSSSPFLFLPLLNLD